MRKRWLILLGLLAVGAVVYAKENPSTFFIKPPYSLERAGSGLQSAFQDDKKRAEQSLSGASNKEAQGLADPQLIEKKKEEDRAQANFFEATTSKITDKKNEVSDKVNSVVNCIDQAGQGE